MSMRWKEEFALLSMNDKAKLLPLLKDEHSPLIEVVWESTEPKLSSSNVDFDFENLLYFVMDGLYTFLFIRKP